MHIRQQFVINPPDVLWLNVSPRLKALSYPLLKCLDRHHNIACWEYTQGQDEPNSIDIAVDSLHDYLQTLQRPIHIVGHGIAGLVGLLYSRLHPDNVKSLSLLSVGGQPAIDWQAHYYARLNLLPCSRSFVLSQMVRELFGRQQKSACKLLESLLQSDLDTSPSPHSMWSIARIPSEGCPVPMFVAGSSDDTVVTIEGIREWEAWFKPGDRLWECPGGRYFFHRFYPNVLTQELTDFWGGLEEGTHRSADLCLAVDR